MRQTTVDSRWKLTIVGYRRIEAFLTQTEATFLLFIFTCILRIHTTCSSIVLHRRLPSNLTIYFSSLIKPPSYYLLFFLSNSSRSFIRFVR